MQGFRWSWWVVPVLMSACGEPPLQPRGPTPGAFHFRLQSFNVEDGRQTSKSTVAAVGDNDADVICLQETGPGWPEMLEATYADEYPYRFYEMGEVSSGGLATLSRYPITNLGVQRDENGWHPASRFTVMTPAGTLDILNVHLRPQFSGQSNKLDSYFSRGSDHRMQIEGFSDHPEQPLNADRPLTLVVGDFNEQRGGGAVALLEDRGFQDTLPLFRPGQGTWRHASLANALDEAIDHILYNHGLSPLNAWVANQGESDHLPLIADFEIDLQEQDGTQADRSL